MENKEKKLKVVKKNVLINSKPVSTKESKILASGLYLLDCECEECDQLHPFTLIGMNSHCACIKFAGENDVRFIKRKFFDAWKIYKNEFVDETEF